MIDEQLEEKQEVEVVEEKPTEKIGFLTPPADGDTSTPPSKKKIKFSNQRKTGLQKASFGFFIASTILSFGALAFFLMPILSALAGVFAVVIIGAIIVIPVLATAFLILLSEEYRQFAGKAWKIVEWCFDVTDHLAELSPYYIYFAIPALAFEAITITLCIVTLAKGQKGVVTYLVITSIFFFTIVVLTIIYFATGMHILVIN